MPTSLRGFSRDPFLSGIHRTLTRLLQPGEAVLVAVSGGPDSIALLHALSRISADIPMRLAVAHLHHGLRGIDADQDAQFVSNQAELLGLPFYLGREDVGEYRRRHRLSLQDAARRVRHAFLKRTAREEGFDKIALGHQADDSAELVLLFLLRGSGPAGLSGIAPRRGVLIRPLIHHSRAEILAFLNKNGIGFRNDRSNEDPRFLRSRIRHDLLPRLKSEYNPNLTDTLIRMAAISRSEDQWMEEQIDPLFEKAVVGRGESELILSVDILCSFPEAACRRVLRRAIGRVKGDLQRISFAHVDAAMQLLEGRAPSAELCLPSRLKICRRYRRLHVLLRPEESSSISAEFSYRMEGPGRLLVKEASMEMLLSICEKSDVPILAGSGQRVAFFDMQRVTFPVVVRNVRPGDRFRPLGMNGTQKIQDFFVNAKVPRSARRQCPVMESQGQILWVIGHRIADPAKVTPESRRILRAEILLAESAPMISVDQASVLRPDASE